MITQISLKTFLLEGRLGPVQTGMTESQIINWFGEPDDKAASSNSLVLMYGCWELYISSRSGILYAIQAETLEEFKPGRRTLFFQNSRIHIEPWLLPAYSNTTWAEVIALLRSEGFTFSEMQDGYSLRIEFSNGVKLTFHHEDEGQAGKINEEGYLIQPPKKEDFLLEGIRYFPPGWLDDLG
jgi:hypothetical protein